MRGISPVIATVLLLLMAVAAVGGAWVWYQKMQSSAQTGGEAGVYKIKAGTGIQYLFIDRAYSSGGKLYLILGNQGPETVTITGLKVDTGSGYTDCNTTFQGNSASYAISSGNFLNVNCTSVTAPSSGSTVKAKIYSNAITKEIQVVTE